MEKLMLVTIGKPEKAASPLIAEYIKRTSAFAPVGWQWYPTEEHVLKALDKKHPAVVLLDERGDMYDTPGFADFLEKHLQLPEPTWFIIGAADGHSDRLRKKAQAFLSLSPLTLQHDIAAVVFAEALYRSLSLRAGHPYHRA